MTKKSDDLAHMGYELMDQKRNVPTREMMSLMNDVELLRDKITITYQKTYYVLQQAGMSLGVISNLVEAVPVDTGIRIGYRSVMGVEIPKIQYDKQEYEPTYGLDHANSKLDYAYRCFYKVREITVILAKAENSVYQLTDAIRKAQERVNALKNIVIPDFKHNIEFIADTLEEEERGELSRQKVIRVTKDRRRAEKSITQCHQLKVS